MSEQPTEQTEPTAVEQDPEKCAFPDCDRPRVPKDPSVRGQRPKYCDDPDHNAITSYKAKNRRPAGPGAQVVEEDLDRPVSGAAKTRLHVGASVLEAVKTLETELPRYLQLMETMNNSEAVEAEVASVAARADHEIAEAQKELVTEHGRREKAERRAKSAEEAKTEAQEAADEALRQLEEAKAKFTAETTRVQEEAAAEVARARQEAEDAVTAAREEVDEAQVQFQSETERIRTEAAAQVEAAQNDAAMEVETAKADATSMVERITQDAAEAREQLLAETASKVAAFKEEADERVSIAETAAGRAQTEVEEMKKTVEQEKASAREVKAKALQDVEDAQARVREAEGKVEDAVAAARQAHVDADAKVEAAKEVTKALREEMGRMRTDATTAQGRIAALEKTTGDLYEQLRAADATVRDAEGKERETRRQLEELQARKK